MDAPETLECVKNVVGIPTNWKTSAIVAFLISQSVNFITSSSIASDKKKSNRADAIAVIKRLKGDITFDEKSPDKPVVGVNLNGTAVSDKDLATISALTNLRDLFLSRTKITEAGLAQLKAMPKLQTLSLFRYSKVTDAGMARLKKMTSLRTLFLGFAEVSDGGVVHLKKMTKLQKLHLPHTKVTDTGLVHLSGLKELRDLNLVGSKVTESGVKKLQAALPNCKIRSAVRAGFVRPASTSARPSRMAAIVSSRSALAARSTKR